ncbi:MAG: M14 family metallopeptidase [Balneola sp.]
MNISVKILGLCCLIGMMSVPISTQAQNDNNYRSYSEITSSMKALNNAHKNVTDLKSVAKTSSGKDIWVLTIGSGDVKNHPGIAVIGGAKGSHILGSELTLKFAEQLLATANTEETKALLASTTFYVFPQVNPDASAQYFADLKYERDGNATSTDADRDGFTDEDGFEDLNGDGFITMMRVENKTGNWTVHKDDARVMVKSDIAGGNKGAYMLLTEGRDNDKDGDFNEDGEGGVNINQNFTFDFPYFKPGSSENPASENETRGVLDFLFEEARNTFAVISFGPENNLSTPLKYNRGAASKRVVSGWLSDDIDVNKMVSDIYNETISLGKAPSGDPQQGDLLQWAYYHYGRYSFSTPGWWTPEVNDEDGKAKKFDNDHAKYLGWADSENQNSFVNWTEVDHPDFPNSKVEVGGLKPFALTTPPYSMVSDLAQSHTDFILKIAEMKPSVELANFKVESAGKNLTRITVDVYNGGSFPTASELGQRNNWVRRVITQIKLGNNMNLVSGDVQSFERSIPADGWVTKTWLIQGSGKVTVRAGSPMTGFSTKEQTIK